MASATGPLGREIRLEDRGHLAIVTEVGATLRSYEVDGVPVVRPPRQTGLSDVFKGSHGQVMMPWVNRVDGGKYEAGKVSFQLPITEVAKNNASQGFVRFMPWSVVSESATSVTLSLRSLAQPGYPFPFDAYVTYTLTAHEGLTTTMRATNTGEHNMPFAMGNHPYLTAGSEDIDDAVFTLGASSYLRVDKRSIPKGDPQPVDGTVNDFRSGIALRDQVLDVAVCDLERNGDGLAIATLRGPERTTTMLIDQAFDYVMVFTGDTLSVTGERRRSVAVEPMSAAPNAYNNGLGLVVLEPGQTFNGAWRVFTS